MGVKKQNWDLFFKTFVGQEVDFIVKMYFKQSENNGEMIASQESPMAIRGFVLDMDDSNIYMGLTPDCITKFIVKESIIAGDIHDEDEDDAFSQVNFNGTGSVN